MRESYRLRDETEKPDPEDLFATAAIRTSVSSITLFLLFFPSSPLFHLFYQSFHGRDSRWPVKKAGGGVEGGLSVFLHGVVRSVTAPGVGQQIKGGPRVLPSAAEPPGGRADPANLSLRETRLQGQPACSSGLKTVV